VPEAISVQALMTILAELPRGLTELGCHPGRLTGDDSTYGAERSIEVDVLSDPRVPTFLRSQGIELRSFSQVVTH
jgi:predicted glycoside hydrolase/deacetylase ChbG (UPF0249 family)